jgi:hypothetical protein
MEQHLLTPPPDFKLYRDKSVYTSTFLGGPLAAGYLAAHNYKHLGQQRKVKTAWLIAILSTIVIFGGALLIPQVENIPKYIIPLIYTGIAQYLVNRFQGNEIRNHIENGGQTYSFGRALLVGLIGLITTLVIVLLTVLLFSENI